MNVAVTGAAGLTGSKVVEALLRQGHHVRAIVRDARQPFPSGVDVVVADVTEAQAVASTLQDREALIHVAGIRLGRSVAAAVTASSVVRIVAVSTAGLYSRSRAAAAIYADGEAALLSTGRSTLLIRPTMIYGSERDRNVHHVIRFAHRYRFLPIVGAGDSLIQPIHYIDLAAVIASLGPVDAVGVVDAGGPEPMSIGEVVAEILAALRIPKRVVRVPYPLARAVAASIQAIRGDRLVERVDRLLEDRSVDISRMLDLSGIRPRSFGAGLREQVREMGL